MSEKIDNLIRLTNKANGIVSGETLYQEIKKNNVFLLILAKDASKNSKKKAYNKSQYYKLPLFEIYDSSQLSSLINKDNRVVIGVTNKNLANNIKKELEGD